METLIMDRFLMKFEKENTKRNYKSNITMFYNFILYRKTFCNDKELLGSIDFDDVEDYFRSLKKKNFYTKNTINLKIEVLKEFFNFAIKRRVMIYNLTDTVDKYDKSEILKEKKSKEIPTIDEVKILIDATYEKKLDKRCQEFTGARDRFLMALLCTTGLRIEEALGIEMKDIDSLSNGLYMININGHRVKNGIDKRVPITKGILKYYYEYEKERDIRNKKFNSDLLFFSINGKKIASNKINIMLKELCEDKNIEKKITNHCFRHFLTQYLKSIGTNNSMIYKILGWVENEIDNEYDGKANDKKYDDYKLKVCDVLG